MQIRSFRESVTKARGPPAPKLLSKTAGCTAGKIVGAPRRAGPQGHRSVSGEFALSRGESHPISLPRKPGQLSEAFEASEDPRRGGGGAREEEGREGRRQGEGGGQGRTVGSAVGAK